MCGIAGTVEFKKHSQKVHGVNSQSALQFILKHQHPRGPDATGTWDQNTDEISVHFGHNRLSILDLTVASNQPMLDSSSRYVLTYNGEIYNYLEIKKDLQNKGYVFKTTGDSEVILAAFQEWGIKAVKYFIGMFAFAIYDQVQMKIWLCRDRFGVKPLFYGIEGNRFIFASSAHAIARALGSSLEFDFLARGIAFQIYDSGESKTLFEGIRAVPPGHTVEIDLTSSQAQPPSSYFSIDESVDLESEKISGWDEKQIIRYTKDLIQNAIELRLRADVPIALSLSGGLDSSTIAAFSQKMKTSKFVGFHFGDPKDKKTEGPLVHQLSNQLGLEVVYSYPKTPEVIEEFENVIKAQETPFGGLSILAQYFVYKEAHKNGFKVLLGGQGGDEAFMGYRKYLYFYGKKQWNENLGRGLCYWGSLAPSLISELRSTSKYIRYFNKYFNKEGLRSPIHWGQIGKNSVGFNVKDPLWKRQKIDVYETSLPTLLRFEDRNSMSQSIESRLPFMDHRLMTLGLALPDHLKVRNGYGKWILREIVKGEIPETISHARYKLGFSVNESQWIEGGLGSYMRSRIQDLRPYLRDKMTDEMDIKRVFSDRSLLHSGTAMADALALIWLGLRRRDVSF